MMQGRIASGNAARDEGPAEMMAVAVENEASLACRSRGEEAGDRAVVSADHFHALRYGKTSSVSTM